MPATARQLLTTLDQLPLATQRALTAHPDQAQAAGMLHLPGAQSPRNIGNFVEKFARVLLLLVLCLFATVLGNTLLRAVDGRGFQSEALVIFAFATALPFGVWLLARRYRAQMRTIDAQIASGELRFGLWLTSTHVVQRDFNSGLEAVARGNVVSVQTNVSGRPPMQVVVLELRDGYRMRIVADWLVSYAGNVAGLCALLSQKLTLPEQWQQPLDAFFAQTERDSLVLRDGQTRWTTLTMRLENSRIAHNSGLSIDSYDAILGYTQARVALWPDEERIAEDIWWQRFVSDGDWEYGVNGVGKDTTYFDGFLSQRYLDWRMPLARSARFCNLPLWGRNEGAFESFLQTPAFEHLTLLDLGHDVGAAWLRHIIDSERFVHLRRLVLVPRDDVPAALAAEFGQWRLRHKVGA